MLLLLSVLAVVSFVSAVPTENFTETKYFVHVNGLSDATIADMIDTAGSWDDYTPNIIGVKNGNVYVESEKDLFRILIPKSFSNGGSLLFNPSDVCVFDSDRAFGDTQLVFAYESHGNDFHNTWNGYNINIHSESVAPSFVLLKGWGETRISNGGLNTDYQFNYIVNDYSLSMSSGWHGGSAVFAILAPKTVDISLSPFDTQFKFYKIINYKFNLRLLEIYTEPGAQVYVGSDLVGTTDNGGYFKTQLVGGDQTLKITKDGYWDYTTTLNIQNDTTLHISLAPKTSLFRVEKNITTDLFPNSIGNVKLHLEPIRTSYGTQMQISGVDVVNVYYKNSLLAPSNGVYVLGTVDSPVDVEIQFKTPSSWGEHSFAVTITATDIEGNQYTNQEQITYEVKELPFLLQNPSWKIGENIVTITDQTGEDYSVLLSLKTVDEKEIWSQSQGFNAYDSYDFTIPINQSGDYVLEILAEGGQVKTYVPVHVIDPIRLLTKEVNASKGSVAVTKLEIENPSSDVKYYDTILVGSIFDANNTPKAEFSIAPNSKKVIEVKFEVPENITFDSYQLSVEVFEMGESDPVFQDDVVLKITESSFIVGFGDSGVPVWALAVAGVLAVCAVGAIILRRRGD